MNNPKQAPPLIYKYFNEHGARVIEDLELKVTPPNEFNDLFEVTPRPSAEPLSQEEFDKLMNSEAGQAWLDDRLSHSEKFRRGYDRLGGNLQGLYKLAVPLMPSIKQAICAKLLDEISKHFGLICFCDDPQHLLMWSHYSDGHKGIVIGFDASKLNLGSIDPVDYVPQRIEHNPPWQTTDLDRMKAIITSKSDLWKYEGESRVMLKLADLKQHVLANGKTGYFCAIPPASIVKIILGFRCSLAEKMRHALARNRITALLQRAKPHPTEFAVILEDEVPLQTSATESAADVAS